MMLDRSICHKELFEYTHKRKDGTFTSEKAKIVSEKYDTIMRQKYGEDLSSYLSLDEEAWLAVAGPFKKGRVFGLGYTLVLPSKSNNPSSQNSIIGCGAQPHSNDEETREMHLMWENMDKLNQNIQVQQNSIGRFFLHNNNL